MIKAVIFDCFGVLLEDALAAMCRELPAEKQQAATDLMHAAHHGYAASVDSNQQIAAMFNMDMEQYVAAIREGEIKNQPLLDYIAELHTRFRTALLSNVSNGGIARRFTESELACFDTVVASGEVGYAKPEPEAYEIPPTGYKYGSTSAYLSTTNWSTARLPGALACRQSSTRISSG